MPVETTRPYCQYCGELASQEILWAGGNEPLLWCEACRHVTILEHGLALQVEPLALSPTLSVRVAALDADHEHLLEILNDLHAAAKAGDRERLSAQGRRLLAELTGHFEREEALLQASRFPQLGEHRDQHVRLFEDVRNAVDLLPKTSADVVVLMIKFWLIAHLSEDMKYKDFLGSSGGGLAADAGGRERGGGAPPSRDGKSPCVNPFRA